MRSRVASDTRPPYLLEDPTNEHGATILFLSQVLEGPPPVGTDVWVTLGGMTVDAFERSEEMQAWYREADAPDGGAGVGPLAAQQMLLDVQSRMFRAWSNDMGGAFCGGDKAGCF